MQKDRCNVLEIVNGTAKVFRPDDCIGDGACLTTCPTKALFIISKHNPESPPAAPRMLVCPLCLE
ncbi:MAG: 4Fe-4S binding protein [Halanaerobiales bacterium]